MDILVAFQPLLHLLQTTSTHPSGAFQFGSMFTFKIGFTRGGTIKTCLIARLATLIASDSALGMVKIDAPCQAL